VEAGGLLKIACSHVHTLQSRAILETAQDRDVVTSLQVTNNKLYTAYVYSSKYTMALSVLQLLQPL